MTSVEPQEGVFNLFFANTADEAYRNQMPILVGPLVYYSGSADWIKQLPRAQMIDAMNGYIKLIMGEIKKLKVVGRPIYKVGNEAYDNNNFLMQTIGPEYIDIAFQAARDADPTAILIYNDYDNHDQTSAVWENQYKRTKDIADRLYAKGLIDGVGIQMGLDGANPPNPQDIVATLPTYPVPAYVTEIAVKHEERAGEHAGPLH